MPVSRRAFLKCSAGLATTAAASTLSASADQERSPTPRSKRVIVVGAGAFGGWTALHLVRAGVHVTLLDAWGPGNSRASSGGETRIIRATYGPDRIYTSMAARSLRLWVDSEKRWNKELYHRTGVLWMVSANDAYEKAALPVLREIGIAFEELSAAEAAKRYPQINFEGVKWAILEKDAGYLRARQACEAVLDAFLDEGGEYRPLAANPGSFESGRMREVLLSDGSRLTADDYVFACGPWLGKMFPDVIGDRIQATRQEVFFFGAPAGDRSFTEQALPVWIDNGTRLFYGIPGNQWRGFKIADDTRGAPFDPTLGERVASKKGMQSARKYLGWRFPELRNAPLLESRVCQYENSPDHHFIVDRHPQARNLWLVGGGSGHGFKHGPAVGEMVSRAVLGLQPAEPSFSLARFDPAMASSRRAVPK